MAEQDPHDLAAACRAVARHLDRLASHVPRDARELFEDTARLLRDRAAESAKPINAGPIVQIAGAELTGGVCGRTGGQAPRDTERAPKQGEHRPTRISLDLDRRDVLD